MSHTHVHHKQRLGPQIFGELQHFMESEAVGHIISPVPVQMAGTLLDGSHGVFPFKMVCLAIVVFSFHIASAGKAHERRLHGCKHFCKVNAAAVGTVLERGREEADDIYVNCAGFAALDGEPAFRVIPCGGDFRRDLFPLRIDTDELGLASQTVSVFILQFKIQASVITGLASHPERDFVGASVHYIDTPEAFVAHAVAIAGKLHPQRMFLHIVQKIVRNEAHCGILHCPPLVGIGRVVFKGAVLNEFRIQAAIAGVVDFLKEDAVVPVAYGRSPLSGIDVKCDLRTSRCETASAHRSHQYFFKERMVHDI